MKREPVANERGQDTWLGNTLRQSPSASAGEACLDAETLAAWADGGLDAKAAAAVELHASNCARCTAVLASIERTAPAPPATPAWTPARLVRWLVPLTAAATAVAIWIVVPDRPITSDVGTTIERVPVPGSPAEPRPQNQSPEPRPQNQSPEPRTQNQSPEPRTQNQNAELGTRNPEPQGQNPEPRTQNQNAELGTRSPEPQDQLRRESYAPEAVGALADAAPEAPPPAAAPPPAPTSPAPASETAAARARALGAAPSAPAPADSLAETVASDRSLQQRSAFTSKVAVTNESTAPSNARFRWRVIAAASIERSTDGGKTWTPTTPPPGVAATSTAALTVLGIRAVDANRAVARTSDGAEVYTTNAGRSWTRVQENSTAPF